MSIKSIDLKFTSANSVPVERAMVTREEWEAVRAEMERMSESLYQIRHIAQSPPCDKLIFKKADEAITKYRSAKQCKACGDFGSDCGVCGNKGDSQ